MLSSTEDSGCLKPGMGGLDPRSGRTSCSSREKTSAAGLNKLTKGGGGRCLAVPEDTAQNRDWSIRIRSFLRENCA